MKKLEKEMAAHSSVLAWRIPGTGEPGGLPSMGLHRVGHDWSDLAAATWKSARGGGHEEGGSAYAKAGSSLKRVRVRKMVLSLSFYQNWKVFLLISTEFQSSRSVNTGVRSDQESSCRQLHYASVYHKPSFNTYFIVL